MNRPSRLLRLALGLGAALATAIVVALAATVLDLYLTGHGHASIGREVVDWPQAGVHLSAADIAMLVAALAAGGVAWRLAGRTAR